jgi:hypothetical protein
MGDNSAENTGNISGSESNHELGSLTIVGLWLGHDVRVEVSNNLFESNELDNGVWNLSAPKWLKALVESGSSFIGFDLVESLDGVLWESSLSGSLHSNLQLKS